ncbi:MAG: hypothetical protein ACM3NR_03075 [Methanosarcina sp.]
MKLVQISVKSHSGYKADEYPLSFIHRDKEYMISEIADRWYQADSNPEFPESGYFKVVTPDGTFIMKHEVKSDNWYLCF